MKAIDIGNNLNKVVTEYGENCWFITQSGTYDATGYDEATYTETGSVQEKAFIKPVNGNYDKKFLLEGTIVITDLKLFIPSGTDIDALTKIKRENNDIYSVLNVSDVMLQGKNVFKKAFIRYLTVWQ